MKLAARMGRLVVLAAALTWAPWAPAASLGGEAKLIPDAAGPSDRVGRSVAMSGDGRTLLLGAPSGFIGSDGPGAAYVYVRGDAGWDQQAGLVPADSTPSDQFGESVALSHDGDTAIVGSWDGSGAPGAVYVFERVGAGWIEGAKLIPGGGPQRYFGWAVAVSGDGATILAGNPTFELGGPGAAFVFGRTGLEWAQTQVLRPADPADATGFGGRVALDGSGDTAAVANNSADAVHVFARRDTGWAQQARLEDADLGSDVDLSEDGDSLVAGANTVWVDSGRANVYQRAGGAWALSATLIAGEPENADWFGSSVAMSADGGAILVGANFSDAGTEVDVGAAYYYARMGDGWSDGEKTSPGDPTFNDEFGSDVALSGDGRTAVVGAPNKDFIDPPLYRGAGYVYELPATVGGSLTGMTSRQVRCTNSTTDQTVQFAATGTSFDCEVHGLVVNPGDRVLIRIVGSVD